MRFLDLETSLCIYITCTVCNVLRAENAAHAWPYKVFPPLYALGEQLTYSATQCDLAMYGPQPMTH